MLKFNIVLFLIILKFGLASGTSQILNDATYQEVKGLKDLLWKCNRIEIKGDSCSFWIDSVILKVIDDSKKNSFIAEQPFSVIVKRDPLNKYVKLTVIAKIIKRDTCDLPYQIPVFFSNEMVSFSENNAGNQTCLYKGVIIGRTYSKMYMNSPQNTISKVSDENRSRFRDVSDSEDSYNELTQEMKNEQDFLFSTTKERSLKSFESRQLHGESSKTTSIPEMSEEEYLREKEEAERSYLNEND